MSLSNNTPVWAKKATPVIGAVGILLGAFGSHGLKELLEANGYVSVWKTAVFYHLIHALLLVFLTFNNATFNKLSYIFCIVGLLLFSGSLYVLSIFEWKWVGVITPFGGLSFILAWLSMLRSEIK